MSIKREVTPQRRPAGFLFWRNFQNIEAEVYFEIFTKMFSEKFSKMEDGLSNEKRENQKRSFSETVLDEIRRG